MTVNLDVDQLRQAVAEEYTEVALCPTKGFHFHTGCVLAHKLGYDPAQVDALPDTVVESFAGVGNPFVAGLLPVGTTVVEVGSGAGLDAILASRQVGPRGLVIGIDMTPAMLEKARRNAELVNA
jgi:arsenite methyltransferase